MGNLLFSIRIEKIERKAMTLSNQIPPAIYEEETDETDALGPVARFNSEIISSTPSKHVTSDGVLRYHDVSGRTNLNELSGSALAALDAYNAENGENNGTWVSKFVDNTTGGQVIPVWNASLHLTTGKEIREIHATEN